MIISRTPLRITLGGGGTDIPSFYKNHQDGFLVSAAINKYIYISVHENFKESILLKYSKIEEVQNIYDIEHPIIRTCCIKSSITQPIEISSLADIPGGTGLGSSGTFTVGLLHALQAFQGLKTRQLDLANLACKIEIDDLKAPVGKQDQYIAALGGIKALEFKNDDSVNVIDVKIPDSTLRELQTNLILFFTGISRSASQELSNFETNMSLDSRTDVIDNLIKVKKSGQKSFDFLENGELEGFAHELTNQWNLKYMRSQSIVNNKINQLIQIGIENGALGGKLIGAGGGGFLLFYCHDKTKLRTTMQTYNLRELAVEFDFEGTVLVK